MSMMSDAAIFLRGFRKILNAHIDFHSKECAMRWDNSSIKPIAINCREQVDSTLSKCILKSDQVILTFKYFSDLPEGFFYDGLRFRPSISQRIMNQEETCL